MMNSIDRPNLDRILDTVLGLLEESYLVEIIDAPVQRAVSTFVYRSPKEDPYFQFVDTTSRFFIHICISVGTFIDKMPAPLAQQEWMNMLGSSYQVAQNDGFCLAYLDALEDIEQVLSHIAGIFISHLRERHARWVYLRWIAGLAWNDRCALVKILYDRSSFLPELIRKHPPSMMADQIFELVSAVVSADKAVRCLLIAETDILGD